MSIIQNFKDHRHLLMGSIVTTLLVFIFLVVSLFFAQYSLGQMEDEYTSIINELNNLFILIQDAGDFSKPEVASRLEILKNHHMQTKNSTFSLLRKVLPVDFPPIPAVRSEENHKAYYDSLVSYTREMRENKFLVINREVLKIYILLGIILMMILLIGYFILHYSRRFYRFTMSINRGIDQIDAHLNFETTYDLEAAPDDSQEIRDFYSYINKINRDIDLDQLLDSIDSYGKLSHVLSGIVPLIEELIPFDRIALAFFDTKGYVSAEAAYTRYREIFLDPGKSEDISRTSLLKLVEKRKPRIIPDLVQYAETHRISESTELILKEGIRSSLTIPLFTGDRCIGFLFFSSKEKKVYKVGHLKLANRIGNKLKSRFYNDFLTQEIISETARSFVSLVNEKDNETSTHLERMAKYAFHIARKLSGTFEELTPQMIREIFWFAPLHDIGKVGVPDAILGKSGPLSEEEIATMRQHVVLGEKIIQNMNGKLGSLLHTPLLDTAVDIIRGHHEKYDGTGYPKGLKGTEIPLSGRIVALADVFDALTSRRVYKPAFSVEESLRIMKEDMKGSFDPTVLKGLEEAIPDILRVYENLKEV